MAMSQPHKTLLTRNRLRLVREMILGQEFYAILQANYTLTPTMIEEIESVKTSQGKVGKLLDILPKRGGVAFPTFIEALVETHQESLAVLLDPSYTSSSPSSSGTVISQPRDSGGDQLTPSNTSSTTVQTSSAKSKVGDVSSGKQPQQPSDALSGKSPSSKGSFHPSDENASSKTASANISGWTDVEEITQYVSDPRNQGFIYYIHPTDDGKEPGKTESINNGRCVVYRNEMINKLGYEQNFDDVNLIETFKKFGIKVESMMGNKSQEDICGRLQKEVEKVTSAFFLFVFAPGSGDFFVTDDGKHVSTLEIVHVVKNSVALKGKPKVLIFHLIESGPLDHMDSVAERPCAAPSLDLSGLSLNAADDNMAILKVAPPSDELKIHWLVSSLIFLMTKYSKQYDLVTILDRVKQILKKQEYSVTLSSSLKSGLYFTSTTS